MKSNVLTAAFVKSVRHLGGRTADRYGDGHGLMLQVMPGGSKQWVQRLALNGRRNDYGLGGYPAVGLAEARLVAARNMAEARAYRLAVHRGEQPPLPGFEAGRWATVAQRTGQPLPAAAALGSGLSFGQAWEMCILKRSKGWKNPATDLRSWRGDLKHHLAGIASLPIAAVTVDTLRQVLAPLARPTASKVLTRAGTVLDWAKAGGHVTSNVARDLRATWRGLNEVAPEHRASLEWREVPVFYRRLRERGDAAALGLAFTLLTMARSKEARLVRYEEVDWEQRTFTVPGPRMKDGRDFTIPLSSEAVEVLRAAGRVRADGFVFRAPRGGPLSDKALRKVLADLGIKATVHGARSTARAFLAEQGVASEIAEECMAHRPRTVARAYQRSNLLERRREEAMEPWGRFVAGGAAGLMPAPTAPTAPTSLLEQGRRVRAVQARCDAACAALRAVLVGGRPTAKDLDELRYRADGTISGDAPLGMRLMGREGNPNYERLPALCLEAVAERGARLAVAFWLLTGAPAALVCGVRWSRIQRAGPTGRTWRGAPLSPLAQKVLARADAIARGDDGTALYIDRLRRYSRTRASEAEWREWLALQCPYLRPGEPKGLVFRDGARSSRRPLKPQALERLFREGARAAGCSDTPRSLLAALPNRPDQRAHRLTPAVEQGL